MSLRSQAAKEMIPSHHMPRRAFGLGCGLQRWRGRALYGRAGGQRRGWSIGGRAVTDRAAMVGIDIRISVSRRRWRSTTQRPDTAVERAALAIPATRPRRR